VTSVETVSELELFANPRTDAFRREVQEWLRTNVPAEWQESGSMIAARPMDDAMAEWDKRQSAGGYVGLSWPEEHGGRGLGLYEELVYSEELAKAHAPFGLGRIGRMLAGPTLIAHGTPEQQARYLPAIIASEEIWCQGFSEPGAGSDLANISLRARPVEGGYALNGHKIWTSGAHRAQRCLLLGRTSEDAPRHRNLSLFAVDMSRPGITVSSIRQISGAAHFNEVYFDDVFVPVEDRIGAEDEGWRIAMTVLTHERGIVEAVSRYVMLRGFADVLAECCIRRGSSLLPRLEDLDLRTDLLRRHAIRAAETQVNGRPTFPVSSPLKLLYSEIWQELTTLGVDSRCARHRDHWRHEYLESQAGTIFSGTSEIQRNIIAERVLGLPR
jgi:alkylation response protein AidB-like acyl-CoA dehydrogenase